MGAYILIIDCQSGIIEIEYTEKGYTEPAGMMLKSALPTIVNKGYNEVSSSFECTSLQIEYNYTFY